MLDVTTGTITRCEVLGSAGYLAPSPDGWWRGYAYWQPGTLGIAVVPSDCSGPAQQVVEGVSVVHLDWSPDGKWFVYTTVGAPGKNQMRLLEVPEAFWLRQ